MSAFGETVLTGSQTGSATNPIDALVPRVLVHPIGWGPSGSIPVNLIGSAFSASITVPSNVNQGNPALLSNAWPVKWTDGTTVFGPISSPGAVVLVSGSNVVGTAAYPLVVSGSGVFQVTGSLGFPAIQQVTGTVGLSGPITGSVSLSTPPEVISLDFAAALGMITGALAETRFGFASPASNGPYAVRVTQYFEPASAAIRSFTSTNVGDAGGGDGARQVTVYGYDGAMSPLSETVTLNGLGVVSTSNSYRFIERMEVSNVGPSGSNLGSIVLHQDSLGSGTVGSIGFGNQVAGVGDLQTFWAHHYVRPGKTMYLRGMGFDFAGNTSGHMFGKVASPLSAGSVELQRTGQFGARFQGVAQSLNVPISIPGSSRFTIYTVNTAGTRVAVSFEYLEF